MGWFRKKKATQESVIQERQQQPFDFTMPVSGGNIFETNIEHNNNIDKTLKINWNDINPAIMDDDINSTIADKQLNWYFHLLLESNYYINTINFECKNPKVRREIKHMILNAFLLGRAGLYYDLPTNNWYCVNIIDISYSKGEIVSAKISEESELNETNLLNDKWKESKIIDNPDLENLYVFNWGTSNYGAYVLQLPFIKLKKQMLDQISVASLLSLKQLEYTTDDERSGKKELLQWLNPLNWVIFKRTRSKDKIHLIETESIINRQQSIIDVYRQTVDIYYDTFGRRNNTDFKKERNVSDEVDASQEQFDCLQKDWLDSFEIFVDEINENKNFKDKIEIIEEELDENFDNTNGKDMKQDFQSNSSKV